MVACVTSMRILDCIDKKFQFDIEFCYCHLFLQQWQPTSISLDTKSCIVAIETKLMSCTNCSHEEVKTVAKNFRCNSQNLYNSISGWVPKQWDLNWHFFIFGNSILSQLNIPLCSVITYLFKCVPFASHIHLDFIHSRYNNVLVYTVWFNPSFLHYNTERTVSI